jgi:hypothetical protein
MRQREADLKAPKTKSRAAARHERASKPLETKDVRSVKCVQKHRLWSQDELTTLKLVMNASPPLPPQALRSLFKRSLCSIRTKAFQIYGHFPKYAVCGRKPKIKHELAHVKSLYCEVGRTVGEIAELYGVKPSTVRGTLHMAGAKYSGMNVESRAKKQIPAEQFFRNLKRVPARFLSEWV